MLTTNIPLPKYKVELNAILQLNSTHISTLINNNFVEENHQGSSCYYRKLQQYIFVYYLCIYIKKRLFYGETLEEIEADLDIANVDYKLRCCGLNLYDFYDIFEITY